MGRGFSVGEREREEGRKWDRSDQEALNEEWKYHLRKWGHPGDLWDGNPPERWAPKVASYDKEEPWGGDGPAQGRDVRRMWPDVDRAATPRKEGQGTVLGPIKTKHKSDDSWKPTGKKGKSKLPWFADKEKRRQFERSLGPRSEKLPPPSSFPERGGPEVGNPPSGKGGRGGRFDYTREPYEDDPEYGGDGREPGPEAEEYSWPAVPTYNQSPVRGGDGPAQGRDPRRRFRDLSPGQTGTGVPDHGRGAVAIGPTGRSAGVQLGDVWPATGEAAQAQLPSGGGPDNTGKWLGPQGPGAGPDVGRPGAGNGPLDFPPDVPTYDQEPVWGGDGPAQVRDPRRRFQDLSLGQTGTGVPYHGTGDVAMGPTGRSAGVQLGDVWPATGEKPQAELPSGGDPDNTDEWFGPQGPGAGPDVGRPGAGNGPLDFPPEGPMHGPDRPPEEEGPIHGPDLPPEEEGPMHGPDLPPGEEEEHVPQPLSKDPTIAQAEKNYSDALAKMAREGNTPENRGRLLTLGQG